MNSKNVLKKLKNICKSMESQKKWRSRQIFAVAVKIFTINCALAEEIAMVAFLNKPLKILGRLKIGRIKRSRLWM